MMLGVDLPGKRPLLRTGHVIGNGGQVRRLAETGNDLLSDRLVAGIDVVEMDRGGVRGLLIPEMGDSAG